MKKIIYFLLMVTSLCSCTFSVNDGEDDNDTPNKNTSEDIYGVWLEDTNNQFIHFFYYFNSSNDNQFEFIRYDDLSGDFNYITGIYNFPNGNEIFLDRKQEVQWVKEEGYKRYGDNALKDVTLPCQRNTNSIKIDNKEFVPATHNMDKYFDILYQCDK